MRVEKTSNLKIYPTKQSIDRPLGIPPPFQDKNSVYVITGGQGSGKSSWIHSALTCRKQDGKIWSGCFNRVMYCSPEETFSSEESHPMKNHVKSRLFHTFDEDMLNNVIQQALEVKHESKGSSLLVIDDFSEEYKNLSTIRLLKKIINKHRHYHLSIALSSLLMKSVPKQIRGLVDYYVIFKPKGLIELEGFTDEVFGLSRKEMLRVMDFVFDAPHNFLLYDNKRNHFHKNFDRLILSPEV